MPGLARQAGGDDADVGALDVVVAVGADDRRVEALDGADSSRSSALPCGRPSTTSNLIRRLGGLHKFMAWPRAILTDSGGFQVFSLSELRKVTDEGVRFRSHLDGSEHLLTPEKAAEIQLALGSDIAMVLDECIETPAPRDAAESAVQRTTLWAQRARTYFLECAQRDGDLAQWQFGIVQGATFPDLRRESAQQLLALGFPGYAVGGLAVGEPHTMTCEITGVVTELLPKERPRYLMGVGRPEQIADYVALGIDVMDCVLPTRAARHACLYTSEGRVLIKNARYAEDPRPIDPNCSCVICKRYTRAYLRHLFSAGEITAAILATHHNVHFYLDLLRQIREAIGFGNLAKFSSAMHARYAAGPA